MLCHSLKSYSLSKHIHWTKSLNDVFCFVLFCYIKNIYKGLYSKFTLVTVVTIIKHTCCVWICCQSVGAVFGLLFLFIP